MSVRIIDFIPSATVSLERKILKVSISFAAHRCPSYQHFLLGRCFKCNTGNCAIMGYHATLPKIASSNSSENEVIPSEHHQQQHQTDQVTPLPGKYYLATGREFPFCRKCPKIIGYSCAHTSLMNEAFLCRASLSIHH